MPATCAAGTWVPVLLNSSFDAVPFDSTGVAIEDAVAAAAVYERALADGIGTDFDFAA